MHTILRRKSGQERGEWTKRFCVADPVSNDKRRRQLNRSIWQSLRAPSTVRVFSTLSYRRSVDNAGSRVARRHFYQPSVWEF